jgi:hypothetical protein
MIKKGNFLFALFFIAVVFVCVVFAEVNAPTPTDNKPVEMKCKIFKGPSATSLESQVNYLLAKPGVEFVDMEQTAHAYGHSHVITIIYKQR